MTHPEVEFKNITKFFGSVKANDSVSFSIQSRSIHGVVGENGAGKSTIMKILYGLYRPDAGDILIRGEKRTLTSPSESIGLGIGMVHQHFMLVPTLTVWQNIVLGCELHLFLDEKAILRELEALQSSFGLHVDLKSRIEALAVGHQQQVEILKLLYRKAQILILDEPTAVLTPQEVDKLFEQLKTLWEKGCTLILITHKLREVLSFTERVTVMRQGRVVDTQETARLNQESLTRLIIGRERAPLPQRKPEKLDAKPMLTVERVTVKSTSGRAQLSNLSLELKGGEILGVAGVDGNGQQELAELLSLVRHPYEGNIFFSGKSVKETSVYTWKQRGIGVIPPDRQREGLVTQFTVTENLILGHHWEKEFTRGGFLSSLKMTKVGSRLMDTFDVRPRNLKVQVSSLSGGNQQKVIVARELSRNPKVILACHPTRGVDIGAIEKIHSLLIALRDKGAGILLISSELDEILALSDRIVVLFEGKIQAEIQKEMATVQQLGLWMTGVRNVV